MKGFYNKYHLTNFSAVVISLPANESRTFQDKFLEDQSKN